MANRNIEKLLIYGKKRDLQEDLRRAASKIAEVQDHITERYGNTPWYIWAHIDEDIQRKILRQQPRYYLITVNFIPNPPLKEVIKLYFRWKKKKWIKTTYTCLEVRNEKYEGLHLHSEVTATKKKPKSEIIRETYSTFKKLLGSKASVDVQINKHGFKPYINGIKNKIAKPTHQYTISYRKATNVPDILETIKI